VIIFLADGRLGNQIFQYVFLKTIQNNNEKIIVSGFEELQEVFETKDIVNFNKKNKWLRRFLFRIGKPILTFLSDKRVISSIAGKNEKILNGCSRELATYNSTLGTVKKIIFVRHGFFQSEEFFNENIANQLVFKEKYVRDADQLLKSIPRNCHKIFVHIRRGDYKSHTVCGKSTLLPLNYYKEKIKWFMANRKDCFFIFLSDEPESIEAEFEYIKNKLVSLNLHSGTDLAIMTKCNSAILSPSSFGWWGSYLMKNKDVVFAPEYWLGFNSRIEYPDKPMASFFRKVTVA